MKKFLVSMIVGLALNSAAFADDIQAINNLPSAEKSLLCVFPQGPDKKAIKINVPLTETGTLKHSVNVDNLSDASDLTIMMMELDAGERFHFVLYYPNFHFHFLNVKVGIAQYPDKTAAPSVTGPWAATFDASFGPGSFGNVDGYCSIGAE